MKDKFLPVSDNDELVTDRDGDTPSNISYGKTYDQETGTWVEDRRFISRNFGDVTKACFACTKAFTCEAVNIEDCKWETPDNVVCVPEVEFNEPSEIKAFELSQLEVDILEELSKKYTYIARDIDDELFVYDESCRPVKGACSWVGEYYGIDTTASLAAFNHLFRFVKWEDEEAWVIEHIIDGLV